MPIIRSAGDVETALFSRALVPPPAPSTLDEGATKLLRQAMARFSSGSDHDSRRSAVDQLVASLDAFPFAAEATRRTAAALEGGAKDVVADIAYVVPVETMAAALGSADADLHAVRSDTRSIAEVIGRGQASTTTSDQAASRLDARFGGPGSDPTAQISLLYQTHDATAAFFTTVLVSVVTATIRRPAVSSTKRTSITATNAAGAPASAADGSAAPTGTTFTLDLEAAGLEFGAGPHHCPGRSIAERIVAGMMHAFTAAAVEIDQARIVYGDDNRATSIPLG